MLCIKTIQVRIPKKSVNDVPNLLTESSGFSFRFHQAQDVVFSDGALDVSHDGSVGVVEEFNSDLGNTTSGAGSAENLNNLGQSNGSLVVHVC